MNSDILKVDAQIKRESTGRSAVEVVVGILVNERQEFLFTSRPSGKVYAGYWEFPGGKVDPNETPEQALARELEEELGIAISTPQYFRDQWADYPHALVHLRFYLIHHWSGTLQMREGQGFSWQRLPPKLEPILPATEPVVQWLQALDPGLIEIAP